MFGYHLAHKGGDRGQRPNRYRCTLRATVFSRRLGTSTKPRKAGAANELLLAGGHRYPVHCPQIQETASARYDAVERSYRYVITRQKDPLLQGLSFFYFKEADLDVMNRAATHLLGTHDFQSFSKVKTDVNHFICTIKHAEWNQKGHLLVFNITANRFLRGMVRAVTGTLLDVGSGKIGIKDFQDILKSRDRKKAGMNVPAEGLFLTKVKYPKSIFID